MKAFYFLFCRSSFTLLMLVAFWGGDGGSSSYGIDEAGQKLRQKKVASLYENVTDGALYERSIDDIIGVLKETRTDIVFRGFWQWGQVPNTCKQLLSPANRQSCERAGYSYEQLGSTISRIKTKMPNILFIGAVPAQIIQRELIWNPKTGEVISYPGTWALALDPGKWGVKITKERFQCEFGKTHLWVPEEMDCNLYDPSTVPAYFPDKTNPDYEKLLLSWAQRQIDAGADAIWVDMLFTQAAMLAKIAGDVNHPSVKESFEAASGIASKIREYGRRKDKHTYVGTWATAALYPYSPPALDFVTVSPSAGEVRKMALDEERWTEGLAEIRTKLGDIPILAFIDWASTTNTPLGVFSQALDQEGQGAFLRIAEGFFTSHGAIFVHPLHGGWMGADAMTLSYGWSRVYDSLAPEFQTYETIKELAQRN